MLGLSIDRETVRCPYCIYTAGMIIQALSGMIIQALKSYSIQATPKGGANNSKRASDISHCLS